jgi:hypothetical protein
MEMRRLARNGHVHKLACRRTVDFIKEDDTRLSVLGFLEKKSQLPFGFSHPFAEAVRSLSHEEGYERI